MNRLIAVFAFALLPSVSCAQSSGSWYDTPEVDATGWKKTKTLSGAVAGGVAGLNMELKGSAGLSWPNGQQAVVTYWQDKGGLLTYCCIDFLKPNGAPSGGYCSVVEKR